MYVTINTEDDPVHGLVYAIDTNINSVLGNPLTVEWEPQGIAYDPVHHRMYIVHMKTGTISIIDTVTNELLPPIPISGNNPYPVGITYDPVYQRMYIANYGADTVSILDTQTNIMITGSPIRVGNDPEKIAYNPVNRMMYVANSGSNTVSVIDTTTSPPSVNGSPIPVGDQPWHIAYDPLHQKMYVGNTGSDTLSLIDTGMRGGGNILKIAGNLRKWHMVYDANHADLIEAKPKSWAIIFVSVFLDVY